MNWKLTAEGSRPEVEAALAAGEEWDEAITLTGFEVDPETPHRWRLEAYTQDKPTEAERKAVRALFDGKAPRLKAEKLPDSDWVTESQRGVEPIRAGRFHVHTPDHKQSNAPGVSNLCIPAAQAFGTGHHATTRGCLLMLDSMQRSGLYPRKIADVGTGTGLLAFAAAELWPRAHVVASDNDPLCEAEVVANARLNGIGIGAGHGKIAMVVADGMDHPALQSRAPFDLLIANILAAPLIDMVWDFADALAPRGSILLAGLLARQEADVRAAYRKAGFRIHKRITQGEWSILWLRRRYRG